MNHTLKQAYVIYKRDGGIVDFDTFRRVCEEFNMRAMDSVVNEGKALAFGSDLSMIYILRINRTFKKLRVDWTESMKYKAEIIARGGTPKSNENPDGEKWLIYNNEPWYVRFYWNKSRCKIPNKTAYRFDVTRGAKGYKGKLSNLLKTDPLAHLMYTES